MTVIVPPHPRSELATVGDDGGAGYKAPSVGDDSLRQLLVVEW
jgi:hypothetical protein